MTSKEAYALAVKWQAKLKDGVYPLIDKDTLRRFVDVAKVAIEMMEAEDDIV